MGKECTPCPGESLQMRLMLEEPSTRSVPLLLNYTLTAGQWGAQAAPRSQREKENITHLLELLLKTVRLFSYRTTNSYLSSTL